MSGYIPKIDDNTFTITDSENGVVVYIQKKFPYTGPFANFYGDYPYFLLEIEEEFWIFIDCLSSKCKKLETWNIDDCEQLLFVDVKDVRVVDKKMYFTCVFEDDLWCTFKTRSSFGACFFASSDSSMSTLSSTLSRSSEVAH